MKGMQRARSTKTGYNSVKSYWINILLNHDVKHTFNSRPVSFLLPISRQICYCLKIFKEVMFKTTMTLLVIMLFIFCIPFHISKWIMSVVGIPHVSRNMFARCRCGLLNVLTGTISGNDRQVNGRRNYKSQWSLIVISGVSRRQKAGNCFLTAIISVALDPTNTCTRLVSH